MKIFSLELPSKGRVDYLRSGEGNSKRILLLHGFPETPNTFATLMKLLESDGWDVVAPFTYGYNGYGLPKSSLNLDSKVSLMDLTDWNYSFTKELGWTRFHALGHDWGAIQTYSLCQKYPESIEYYFALSVPPLSVFLKNLLRNPLQFLRSWYILFFQTGLSIPEKTIQNSDFLKYLWKSWSPNLSEEHPVLQEVQELFRDTDRLKYALSYYRGLFPGLTYWGKWNESRELVFRKINVAGKILSGSEDGCISIDMYQGYESAVIDGTEWVVLPGKGHFLPLEAAGEIFQEIKKSLLA